METRQTILSSVAVVTAILVCLLMMTAVPSAQSASTPMYAAEEISVDPEPPIAGLTTELCVDVQNPTASSETVQLEFGVAELGIGVSFTLVGNAQLVVPAGGKATGCVNWVPSSSGPWSIQAKLIITGSSDTISQRNLVMEESLASGVSYSRSFKVGNPTSSTAVVSLGLIPHITGWILGLNPDTLSNMAPGSEQTATLIVTPPANLPANGSTIVDVEGYVGGVLIGGFRMVYNSGAVTTTTTTTPSTFSIAGTIMGDISANVPVELLGDDNQIVDTDNMGHYEFPNLNAGGFYLIIPQLAGYEFDPPQHEIPNLMGDELNMDFLAIKTGPCVAKVIYGEESEEVELLRYFRDKMLNQTPAGQELIELYYQWSPAIVKVMEEDMEFKEELKELLEGILPMIR